MRVRVANAEREQGVYSCVVLLPRWGQVGGTLLNGLLAARLHNVCPVAVCSCISKCDRVDSPVKLRMIARARTTSIDKEECDEGASAAVQPPYSDARHGGRRRRALGRAVGTERCNL